MYNSFTINDYIFTILCKNIMFLKAYTNDICILISFLILPIKIYNNLFLIIAK